MRVCSYPFCTHGPKDPKGSKKLCKMHKLPSDREKCRMWMMQCRVEGTPRKLPAAIYICSCYFVGGHGPTKQDPHPIAFMTPAKSMSFPGRSFRVNVVSEDTVTSDIDDPDDTPPKNALSLEEVGIPHSHSDGYELLKSLEKVNVIPPVINVNAEAGLGHLEEEDKDCESMEKLNEKISRFPNLGQIMRKAMTAEKGSFSSEHSTSNSEQSEMARSLGSFEWNKDEDNCDFKLKKRRKLETAKAIGTSDVPKRDFSVQCEMAFLSYEKMMTWTGEDFQYFTGISKDSFEVLYEFLGGYEVCRSLKYSVHAKTPVKELNAAHCPKGNLLMTLVRLRRGYSLREMVKMFNLSTHVISYIFTAWIKLMSIKFKSLEDALFVSSEAQEKNRPRCFKPFPNLRCIVDCTEIRIQKPNDMEQQSNTFSSYKGSNTFKFLIACSVYGGLSFLSEGFEGSMSDRQVFIKSGILDHLNPGDAVMVDRGFDIEDILNKHDIHIIIPPFLGARSAFTEREMYASKSVATTRIHVETLIGRIKNFKFLRFTVPNTMLDIVSDVMRVCSVLCNFNDPFINWEGDSDKTDDILFE